MLQLALPDSMPAHVEVWRLDLDLYAPVADADWAILGGDEGVRALRFARIEDRMRYVSTRAALRRLLAFRLRRRPQDLRLFSSARGKPQLTQPCGADEPVEFNVSHAGAHALIAISHGGAVGVDIERCDPALDVPSLEQQVLSARERQMDARQQPGFFERWVAKEAVLKTVGVGLASHLLQLSVEKPQAIDDRRYHLHDVEPVWPLLGAWRLDAPTGYVAAVACVLPGTSQPLRRCGVGKPAAHDDLMLTARN